MKFLSLILACIMVLCVFVGCNDTGKTTTPKKTTKQPTTPVEPEDETPEIEYVDMYFDDRKSISTVFGGIVSEFEIVSEEVTSTVVGTDEKDTALIIYDEDSGTITAVGTGTAVVKVNGEEKNFRVLPAPITLAVITGHSIGAGSQGNAKDSVLCEAGQVYNTTLSIKDNPTWNTAMKGSTLGIKESDRVVNIDGITTAASSSSKGARGVNSGLAFKWNEITGEKMWVVNCAVGGSCINQWQPGAKDKFFEYSLGAINLASEILKGEVEAGHYEYRSTVIINFSSANFGYQNIKYDDEMLQKWHDNMWAGYVDGVTVDIDGDGKVDAPASIGYVPIWTPTMQDCNTRDYPLIYYRAASAEYSHVFLASDYARIWRTDEGVSSTFPKIKYKTQNNKVLDRPTKTSQVFDDDGTHLQQVAYNAVGMQIAESLYSHVYGAEKVEDVTLYEIATDGKGVEVKKSLKAKEGQELRFLLITDPNGVSNYTIELSSNLKLDGFFYVTATAKGEGTLTIKQGDTVIKTVTITVE